MSNYYIRPGRFGDLSAASELYTRSFGKETLLDFIFPSRQEDPASFHLWIARKFEDRWWTPGWTFTMLLQRDEKGTEHPLGFTWWQRPHETLTFREKWLSPFAWIARIVNFALRIRNKLYPIPVRYPDRLEVYSRTFATVQPTIITTQRRRDAWYLASLGVEPSAQGKGIGSMLLRDGLREADEAGAATWLVALKGLETYYERVGFTEVGRANVGELKDWEGGAIMFRGD